MRTKRTISLPILPLGLAMLIAPLGPLFAEDASLGKGFFTFYLDLFAIE